MGFSMPNLINSLNPISWKFLLQCHFRNQGSNLSLSVSNFGRKRSNNAIEEEGESSCMLWQ